MPPEVVNDPDLSGKHSCGLDAATHADLKKGFSFEKGRVNSHLYLLVATLKKLNALNPMRVIVM